MSAVAGKDFVEESEVIGNAARELAIGAGGETLAVDIKVDQ